MPVRNPGASSEPYGLDAYRSLVRVRWRAILEETECRFLSGREFEPRQELHLSGSTHGRLRDHRPGLMSRDLLLCEDGPGTQHVIGVTREGAIYKLARNAGSESEFAGATFSADGTTLFVNVQAPGVTYAITGPWDSLVAKTRG